MLKPRANILSDVSLVGLYAFDNRLTEAPVQATPIIVC